MYNFSSTSWYPVYNSTSTSDETIYSNFNLDTYDMINASGYSWLIVGGANNRNQIVDYASLSYTYSNNLNITFIQPTTSDTSTAIGGETIPINFTVQNWGVNATSGVTFNNATIGDEYSPIVQSAVQYPIIYIRINDTETTGTAGTDTIYFDSNYSMHNIGYSIMLNPLTDDDVVYSMTYLNKTNSSFDVKFEDDTGTNEQSNYMVGAISKGDYDLGNDNYIKCGNRTASVSTSTATFDTAFPDTEFAVICTSIDNSDSPLCFLPSFTAKTDSTFPYRIQDDGGAAETVSEIDYCAFSYGEYTVDNVIFKAGNIATDADSDLTISLTTAFTDTDYAVFVTTLHPSQYTPYGCSCQLTERGLSEFNISCRDSSGDDSVCDDAGVTYDWVAMSKVQHNITYYAMYDQIGCHSDGSCQANITMSTGLTGTQDLFLNLTYDSTVVNATCKDCIDYGGAEADPCEYSGTGNYNMPCGCNLTTNQIIDGGYVNITGTGTTIINGTFNFTNSNPLIYQDVKNCNFRQTRIGLRKVENEKININYILIDNSHSLQHIFR